MKMRTIQRGDAGDAVKAWQTFLGIEADGIFGEKTEAATRAYQEKHKFNVDGIVGIETWASTGLQLIDSEGWPTQAECDDFYGNPRGHGGGASHEWETKNLVLYHPPWRMIDEDSRHQISGITVHKRCLDSMARIFEKAWEMYGKSQAEIEKRNLHLFSGSYVFRNIRGSSRLSMHSYGCAIDIAAGLNELGEPYDPKHGLPIEFVRLWEDEGWTWGGRWQGRPDAMHFQAAYVHSKPEKPVDPKTPVA